MWFLEEESFHKMQAMAKDGLHLNQERCDAYMEKVMAYNNDNSLPRGSSITPKGIGEINISGVLTKKPDFLSMLFGGGNTTYDDIQKSIALFEQDDNVSEIILNIDSVGGNVNGLFEAMDAIRYAKKPTKSIIRGACYSAAYGLASQANQVIASHKSSSVGSVGVLRQYYVSDNRVTITSTEAPEKAPDVRTPEGVLMVKKEMDDLHNLFVEQIAEARKTNKDYVNANYGRGGVLLASEALARGMIDSIGNGGVAVEKNNLKLRKSKEVRAMDLKQLKSEYPDLCNNIAEQAVASERDRVSSHLIMGEASGDLKTAIQAVKDGSLMTAALQATYMAAGMVKKDIEARQDDEQQVAGLNNLTNKSTPSSQTESEVKTEAVLDEVLKAMGASQ